jgi:hypothetical protein
LGTDSVTGDADFVLNVSVMLTGTDGDVASGKAGVMTVTASEVITVTGASRVIPAAVRVARVVEASPGKRPPLIVRGVPPVEGPKLGLQKVKKGATAGEGWNEMEMVAEPDCDPTEAFARTVARPTEVEQRAVVAVPP